MSNSVKSTFASANSFLEGHKIRRTWLFFTILGGITAIITFIAMYFNLMAFSIASVGFRFFVVLITALWATPLLIKFHKPLSKRIKMIFKASFWVSVGSIAITIIMLISVSPLFMANNYRELITVKENGVFVDNVENFDTMQIPIVDRAYAVKLGDKKLGEGNYGSQFYVGNYTMMAVNGQLVWVAPLEYRGFFQWTDKPTSPGYVKVVATEIENVEIVLAPLKYLSSAFLATDLERNLYFNAMTMVREDNAPHLELDDNNKPFFIQSVIERKFAMFSGDDTVGVLVCDAENGATEYYPLDKIPSWVDKVHPTNVLLDQLNNWGAYVNGFFNTWFAKTDILTITEGYNFIYSNDRLYLYTGMTSIGNDESIVGVMMVDIASKETFFHKVSGATEFSAAQSAIGKAQEKRYTSSSPILINFNGTPTYFMTLKDDEGLIKMYGYVNVANYNTVAVSETMEVAQSEYAKLINTTVGEIEEQDLVIKDINKQTENGSDYYYLRFVNPKAAGDAGYDANFENYSFRAIYSISEELKYLKAGDRVKVQLITSKEYMVHSIKRAVI